MSYGTPQHIYSVWTGFAFYGWAQVFSPIIRFLFTHCSLLLSLLAVNSLRPSDAYMRLEISPHWFDNGLSPGRCRAIIWTNAGILLIWPLGTNFNEIFYQNSYIFIQENPFENVVWKMACIFLGLNVLKHYDLNKMANILQTTFSDVFYFIPIALKYSNEQSTVVQVTDWRHTGPKSLNDSILTQFDYTYSCHQAWNR